jgi:UDP-2,3-diacylglucosamine hydrolase
MSTGPLGSPVLAEFVAPDAWRAIDLISDLHLSESTPRTFDAWAAHLQHTDADAVFILGDLFDVWIGDDARNWPFERRCIEVLATASRRTRIGFMAGNRDFLVGPAMLAACGASALADPTLLSAWGQRVLLTHGDALCIADTGYQRLRLEVRSETWRKAVLSRPLVDRATLAREMRAASHAHKRDMPDPALWADVDTASAMAWMQAGAAAQMVHGHTHRPGRHALAPGLERQVLSDWDLEATPARADVLRLSRTGLARLSPSTPG